MDPVFIIWKVEIFPLENIMALGGVATGRIKAQLPVMTQGIASKRGSLESPIAMDATMGRKVAMVAVLLASSVMRRMINEIIITVMMMGRLVK